MLKRAIRNCIKRFEAWLDDESDSEKKSPGEYEFIYPWLNSRFLEIVNLGLRRPYAWGILQGVNLAHALGIGRVSILEFGVAGGNGQVEMERIAAEVEKLFDVQIDIYGFDTGVGLPGPMDYRDVPNLCSQGLYCMDQERLRSRLRKSQLILGNIKDTISDFVRSGPSPIAFIACDLVLYTSTVEALRILEADERALLPRIYCYFDDVLGFTYGDCNGERLAIHEFNLAHHLRNVSPVYGLKYYLPTRFFNEMWLEKFWIAHIFDHSMYIKRDNSVNQHNLSLAVN